MKQLLQRIKCKKCDRVLCDAKGTVKIKCRKCGYMNYIETDIEIIEENKRVV